MLHLLRVGIPLVGNWLGGFYYTENLIRSLRQLPDQERPALFLVITDETYPFLDLYRPIVPLFDGLIFLSQTDLPIDLPITRCQTYHQLFDQIDFLYPCLQALPDASANHCYGTWIPDFQHVDLPHLFTPQDQQERNNIFFGIAVTSRLTVFSSHHAVAKFQSLYPDSQTIPRILPFHTLPDANWYGDQVESVRTGYGLPERFLICTNQFWRHKDHGTLFRAIAHLRQQGTEIALVCTGTPSDYRASDYFDSLKTLLNDLGIQDLVYILGAVSRQDQIQLLRGSLAVVQPSLYEGWSTVLEEARTLGKPAIASDFPVHLEQNLERATYFQQGNGADLARAIAQVLPTLTVGLDLGREAQARLQAEERAKSFAQQFGQIVVEAQFIFSRQIRGMSDQLWQLLSEPLTLEAGTDAPQPSAATADLERLQAQLRQAQIELVRSQSQNRTLKRSLDETTTLATTYEAAAAERLQLLNQLHQQAEELQQQVSSLNQKLGSIQGTARALVGNVLRQLGIR